MIYERCGKSYGFLGCYHVVCGRVVGVCGVCRGVYNSEFPFPRYFIRWGVRCGCPVATRLRATASDKDAIGPQSAISY